MEETERAGVFQAREIAGRIAARLTEAGCPAEVRPIDGRTATDGYSAFVLGSAVHSQRWLPDATAVVQRHRNRLAECPWWAFSVGMPAALREP